MAEDKRELVRSPVLRAARVHFGGAAIDCLVLDESASGLRVSMDGFIAFPERVTVELRSGALWHAVRRWQRGTEAGLELLTLQGLTPAAATRAAVVRHALRTCGAAGLVQQLADERYFDSPELREGAVMLTAALDRLDELLGRLARSS